MSYIGEARGFAKSAREIGEKLKNPNLTPAERAELEKKQKWYAEESEFCWSAARQEAREDAAYDRRDDE